MVTGLEITKKETKKELEVKNVDMTQHTMLSSEKQQQIVDRAKQKAQVITGKFTKESNIRESAIPPTDTKRDQQTENKIQQERNCMVTKVTKDTTQTTISFSLAEESIPTISPSQQVKKTTNTKNHF